MLLSLKIPMVSIVTQATLYHGIKLAISVAAILNIEDKLLN